MAADVGARVPLSAIRLNQSAAVELRVEDIASATHGWVYLLRFEEPPPRSPRRYLTVEKQQGELRGWRTPIPSIVPPCSGSCRALPLKAGAKSLRTKAQKT